MTVTLLGLSSQEILDDFECIYVAFVENDELSKIRAFNLKDIHEKKCFLIKLCLCNNSRYSDILAA